MNTLTLGRNCFAVALLAVAVTTMSPSPVQAADADVVTKMTPRKLEQIMNWFNDVKNFKEVDDNRYTFETGGYRIGLFNCGDSLEIFAVFTDQQPTLTQMNEWNRTKKFTRAYLNKDNDAVLYHSLELTGGVTEKNVKEWIMTFAGSLKEYKKHIAAPVVRKD